MMNRQDTKSAKKRKEEGLKEKLFLSD